MKQSLEKRLTVKQGATQNPLTLLEFIPAENCFIIGKSPGNPAVELATSNGTTPHATTGGTPHRVRQFLMGETPKTGLPHRNAVAHQSNRGNE
ncbi:hypothetical protein ACEYW6_36465 [Nostoc sp. UIC 10607]|uniref:hypothetical protein n=1 Tax=Nostoc sp. UIC 10607 TaxID=3045935 RepID=UPI00399FF9A1